MTDTKPYQVEYAKSGRASCKGCKNKIEQGELRIAVMVQSAFFDGKQANWHHEECFFKKQRPRDISDISNFTKLRPADQKRIKELIAASVSMPEPVTKGKGKGKKRAAAATSASAGAALTVLKDFQIEYSKSSRATCKYCDIKICKDEIRVAKTVYDTEVGMKYGGQPLWHHLACFAKDRVALQYYAAAEDLTGFKQLSKGDQEIVKKELVPLNENEVPIKKLKEEPKDEVQIKAEIDLEKKMVKQNKLFHKYKKALSELSKSDLHELLEENSQNTFSGKDLCLEHLADCMAFGALEPCPECKQGQLVLDDFYYKCTGNLTEWTKCSYTTQTPKRRKLIIPEAFAEGSVFNRYKPKVDERAFAAPPPAPVLVMPVKKEDPDSGPSRILPIPPLKNLQFLIVGKLKTPKEEIKKRILKMGGLVVNSVTDTTAAAISTKNELEKMLKAMTSVSEADVEVVEEDFLDKIDPVTGTIDKTLELIKEHNIAPWGSGPKNRVPQDVIDGKSISKSGSQYAQSKSKSTKLKIKGGTAVDPESGLEDVAHVYTDKCGVKYTVVLTKTDVVAQTNSYYKLQLLEDDAARKYSLFRSWGRIGTSVGKSKVESCKSREDGIRQFERLFMEKTENPWNIGQYHKEPGCYFPVEVDYGDADDEAVTMEEDKACKLPLAVQKLIMKIFDVNMMKRTLVEFELDTEKMPLGKLSKQQIKSGYKVLTELLKNINDEKGSKSKIVDATNRFFTLIPHSFGMDSPPLLNTVEAITQKTQMLDNLLEIEIAYSLLKSDSDSTSPIEANYLKLKAEIAPLETTSSEFEIIQKYVQNTHAATHSNYTLDIEQVFKVVREGEDRRFKPFKKLHNRRLLWHGSRVTNFAGILSQGLRIAPPEAPVTGYMFGKGIYFADMVSKSANYCCTDKINPVGVLLLCEVALGDMHQCHRAQNFKSPPAGSHSVWGLGRTWPDPLDQTSLADGVLVPCGKPVPNDDPNCTLLYNEFIVYDVAQVRIKYLLQLKFNYKY